MCAHAWIDNRYRKLTEFSAGLTDIVNKAYLLFLKEEYIHSHVTSHQHAWIPIWVTVS